MAGNAWWMSVREYEELTAGARELERDRFGIKVLLTPDDRIIKLFRIKRLWSLAAIYPYSFRFRRNAERLRRTGIRTVRVERVFYCHAIRRHGVIYPRLAGETLAELLQRETPPEGLLQQLAVFVAQLHLCGIYFRSLHLGNVLRLPTGELGLIDVADLRFRYGALSPGQRARNFRHLLRRPEQRAVFERFGIKIFLDLYLRAAELPVRQAETIRAQISAQEGR
jgi:hypothetical protein